jgi:integrase/recombinase XerD
MQIYRRHLKTCGDSSRLAGDCACPLWADWKWLGKRVLSSLKTSDRKQADANLRRLIKNGPPPKQPKKPKETDRPEYSDYLERFLADREGADLTARTIQHYRIILDAFGAYKGSYSGVQYLDEINKAKVEAFLASREGRSGGKPTQQTKRSEVDVLRAFMKYCISHDVMKKNFASEIKIKVKDRKRTARFTDEEMDAILKAAGTGPLLVLIELMVNTGLRLGDAVTLKRSDLDDTMLKRKMQKSRYTHTVRVPLDDNRKLLADLRALPASDEKDQYFFYDGFSEMMSVTEHWRHQMRIVFARAGVVGGHPHRFRDTFAMNLRRRGVAIDVISQLLGHRDVRVTQRAYVDNDDDATLPVLRDAMKLIAPTPGPTPGPRLVRSGVA